MTPSRSIKLFGTDEPAPEPRLLKAGPLEASFEAGNLRYIKVGGEEVLRAIAYLVRDKNWGTYNPEISDLEIEEEDGRFLVTYRALCKDAAQSFRYDASIEGKADGTLLFEAVGEALTDFLTNRTGFVVLHALEGVVGAPLTVEHVDGKVVESRFPEFVDPVCPFQNIRALTHRTPGGVSVSCRMEGDAFEMEDHRNWMDASYKTYVRPLALPWPYTIGKGEKTTQRVTLAVEAASGASAHAGRSGIAEVSIAHSGGLKMPRIGLAVAPEYVDAALEKSELLRAARPSFLVCHFDLRKGHDASAMRRYQQLGAATGAALVLEAVVPCLDEKGKPTDDQAILERDMAAIANAAKNVPFERVAVSPASDLKCTLPGSVWPKAPAWDKLMHAARENFPRVPVGGGMFSYFTELNRKRPPAQHLDFICHTGSPLVHAGDDTSVTETLEALPSIFRTVESFSGGKPYWLFPTAISMRDNPYGAVPAENPNNIRQAMNRVDPRERGLLAAAWYTGYLSRATAAYPEALTLGAAAGPSGIVYTKQPHAQPWFDEAGAQVMPHYFPIAGAAALSGGDVLAVETSDPRKLQAYAVARDGVTTLWIANLSPEERVVRLTGVPRMAHLSVLDEATFEAYVGDARMSVEGAPTDGEFCLSAFAVARLSA